MAGDASPAPVASQAQYATIPLSRLGNKHLRAGIPRAPRYPFAGRPTDPSMRPGLSAAAVLAALLVAAPAHAAGLSGMGANLFGNYFHFGTKPNLPKPPVHSITAGPLHMELQHTRLSQIKKLFGGTIQSQGSGSGVANWLCYHTDGSGKSPAAN